MTTKTLNDIAIVSVALTAFLTTFASADPTGTTFSFLAMNFQGDGADPAVPFGTPTSIPGAGVIVDSSVTTSPAFPGLTIGGKEFLNFTISTEDSGYLNSSIGDDSLWVIDGLNWGADTRPAVATGLVFLSFGIDGTPVDLTEALGIPIVPNPVTGAESIPLDVEGDDASLLPFDTASLGAGTLGVILSTFGVPLGSITSVDSMSIGLEIMHVPEPTSGAIFACGLVIVAAMRRRLR